MHIYQCSLEHNYIYENTVLREYRIMWIIRYEGVSMKLQHDPDLNPISTRAVTKCAKNNEKAVSPNKENFYTGTC